MIVDDSITNSVPAPLFQNVQRHCFFQVAEDDPSFFFLYYKLVGPFGANLCLGTAYLVYEMGFVVIRVNAGTV